MLKTTEVAQLLRVHPKHIYRLLREGLPGRRVGGEWRFVREEVLAWSAARGGAPAPAPAASTAAPTPPPLLGANGDLVIDALLAELVAQRRPLVGLVQTDRGTALSLLADRALLIAGFHGEPPPKHLEAARLVRIHLVRREVGLAHPKSLKVRRLADIRGCRLALRPLTAGVRQHFDRALASAKLPPSGLQAKATNFASHADAVCAVAAGKADVALTTAAWAQRMGLALFPLAEEPYELLLFAENLGEPHVVGICETVQTRAFRERLKRFAGYDPRGAGAIRYETESH